MFNIGDLLIYSAHGICKVEDICERTFSGITKTYYVLHPIENENSHHLKINAPVNSDKIVMKPLVQKEEAYEILGSFKHQGIEWNDVPNRRQNLYSKIVKNGDRKEIATVVNTLMRKEIQAELHEKKFFKQDRTLLERTQNTLFKELAISLNKPFEEINDKAKDLIKRNLKVIL